MSILIKHHHKILWILIILYIIIFSSVCLWKYYNFGYNSLDLAVINQTFYNTAHGDIFASSIHEPSYLGDHFNPILFLLLPFYWLLQSPVTLLVLQSIFLGLAAWPLYLVSKNIFKDVRLHLLFPIAYLINPFVHNTNIFEFHFLALGYLIFFFSYYFYQQKKFVPFLIFIILSLFLREDVSLFIFCFGLFILIDKLLNKEKIKPNIRWILSPIILSIIYFFIALKIISFFNPDSGYKFLIYYTWLGNSLGEVIKNLLFHLPQVISNIFRFGNIELAIGLLLPFLFLPLLRARFFIIPLAIFLQIALSNLGGSGLILKFHYSVLLSAPLFIAAAYGLQKILLLDKLKDYKKLVILIFIITSIYSSFTLGIRPTKPVDSELLTTKKELLKKLPAEASVITSYDYLSNLSSRQQIYSYNYAFMGKRQLSTEPYEIPQTTEYILADLSKIISFQMQYEDLNFYKTDYYKGSANLRELIKSHNFGLVEMQDTIAIFKKDHQPETKLYLLEEGLLKDLFNCSRVKDNFTCSVQFENPPTTNYQYQIELKNNDQTIYNRYIPIAYGFYSTSKLRPGEKLTTDYSLILPNLDHDQTCINLVYLQGDLALNKLGFIYNFITEEKIIDQHCFN